MGDRRRHRRGGRLLRGALYFRALGDLGTLVRSLSVIARTLRTCVAGMVSCSGEKHLMDVPFCGNPDR